MIRMTFSDGSFTDLQSPMRGYDFADVLPFKLLASVDFHATGLPGFAMYHSQHVTVTMHLTVDGDRAFRELMFFGKHLKPAPARIEFVLQRREAWELVYHTACAKIKEVLDDAFHERVEMSTSQEALNFLNRVAIRACERMEDLDEQYTFELMIDEED